MSNKLYALPEEIHELFLNGQAAEACRDACIKNFFRAKRAIYYAKESRRLYTKAWNLVYNLWPEVREGEWQYDFNKKTLKKVVEEVTN